MLEFAVRDGRVAAHGWRLRKDGSRFWADVLITALRGDAGQISGYAKLTRDMTSARLAEERLRQSEERLIAFTEDSPAAMYLTKQGQSATGAPGHRLALNDTIYYDSRIPPKGMIATATTAPHSWRSLTKPDS